MAIRTKIVRIGNSQGIRLSKNMLEQSGLSGEVDIEVTDDKIVLHSVRRVRENWETAFANMNASGDDRLLDADAVSADLDETGWDDTEWEWK